MTRVALASRHALSARGSALIAVVFTLLIVAAIAGSLIAQTRTDLALSQNLQLGVENDLSAEAGIAVAVLNLSDPGNKNPFIPDGRFYDINIDGKRLSVQVQSEAGKINLNQSPNPLLKRLFRACTDEGSAELLGKAVETRTAARDGPAQAFLTIDELRRLPGASEELIAAIEPFVSVYNFRAEPDFRLAPDRLRALMVEGQSRPSSELASSAGAPSNLSGIYTITATVLDSGSGASIRAIVYVTGDKRDPYYVFDWRRLGGRASVACKEAQAQ
jgi:general secretion pathway protein K